MREAQQVKGPWWSPRLQARSNPGAAGPLRGGNFPESTSYWGNLLPAIAYAVHHNVPGAQAAYTRMTSASNWNNLVTGFANAPVWAVAPKQ